MLCAIPLKLEKSANTTSVAQREILHNSENKKHRAHLNFGMVFQMGVQIQNRNEREHKGKDNKPNIMLNTQTAKHDHLPDQVKMQKNCTNEDTRTLFLKVQSRGSREIVQASVAGLPKHNTSETKELGPSDAVAKHRSTRTHHFGRVSNPPRWCKVALPGTASKGAQTWRWPPQCGVKKNRRVPSDQRPPSRAPETTKGAPRMAPQTSRYVNALQRRVVRNVAPSAPALFRGFAIIT